MTDALRAVIVLDETPTPHGYVIREEIWPSVHFDVEVIDDAGDPETLEDARQMARDFAEGVS